MIQVEPLDLHENLGTFGEEVREELWPPTGRDADELVPLHVAPELRTRVDVAHVLAECNHIVGGVTQPTQVLLQDVARLHHLIELVQTRHAQRLARIDPLGVDRRMPIGLDEAAGGSFAKHFQVLRNDVAELGERELKWNGGIRGVRQGVLAALTSTAASSSSSLHSSFSST